MELKKTEELSIQAFANNNILFGLVKDFFKKELSKDKEKIWVRAGYPDQTNDVIGAQVNANITAERIINTVFNSLERYKTQENKTYKGQNPAR